MNAPSPPPPARRLRIAVLSRSFVPTGGGAERYAIALVEALATRHEVHVFAQQIDHQQAGVHYHRLAGGVRRPRWVNQLIYAWTAWRATRSGFDVVHSHEMTWHGQVQTVHVQPLAHSLFAGRTGLRWALRWLKVLTSPRLLVYLALERARLRAHSGDGTPRCIVATSDAVRDVLLQAYPALRDALVVLTPGVAQVQAHPGMARQMAARVQLKLPVVGRCVLLVANDFQKKGLPALLQALPALPDDVYLAVVGGAPHVASAQQECAARGLQARVHFVGALQAVDLAYQSADVLAHPTLEDTFAMVVLEAMAQGLPVVASALPYCGIAALLNDGQDALLLPNPRDSAALAKALGAVLGNTALRQHLSEAGLALAKQHLWSAVAQRQDAVYQRVACKA